MARFGLTADLLATRPWGLDISLLRPEKTITDPVHQDMYFTELERMLIDAPPFQRLRRVKQLGNTHLVYPGASHSRFSHSLGAVRSAQNLIDCLVDHSKTAHQPETVFDEWKRCDADGHEYRTRLAEAIVLARLGALLHDFCHVPYGHTVEDDFGLFVSHDKNEPRFKRLWGQIADSVRDAIPAPLLAELKMIMLSKLPGEESKYPFVHDIVGNTICADLYDYLRRDYYHTGLKSSLGSRFLNFFFVARSSDPLFPRRMVLNITKRGGIRPDVVSEVLKYLRHRYELQERVLNHHAKLAADSMIGRALSIWAESQKPGNAERILSSVGDEELIALLSAPKRDPQARELACGVRDRQLYKTLFGARGANRKDAWAKWGGHAGRAEIEESIARRACIKDASWILLWVPHPDMRMKLADLVVWTGDETARMEAWDAANEKRANEIYEAHEALWAMTIFVHPAMTAEDRTRVKAAVRDEIRLPWGGRPASTGDALYELAIKEVTETRNLRPTEKNALTETARRAKSREDTIGGMVHYLGDKLNDGHKFGLR